VVLRRTSLAITGRISLPMIQDIAMQMAKTLGWSGDTTQTEIETLITELHQYHGVSAEMLAQRSRPRSTQCA
jgi:glycerol-3-phosphate dehydrogenase